MPKYAFRLLVLLLVSCGSAIGDEKPLERIHFGSCIKQEKPIPIVEMILARKPELFLFLGDNIYADTMDMAVMRSKYATLKEHPDFSKLAAACPHLAVWDDHDFGTNDAGADYPKRKEAQEIFLDFWEVAKNSPRRKREGVYDSQIIGPEGKRVQIIMLDTRYFRGPLKKGDRRVGGVYYSTDDTTIPMLGDAQWKWLEAELQKPAELRILASGIQIVPEASGQETWSNLPHERQRLFDLIGKTKANGVILISGDRHWAELSVAKEKTPYPIYDLTSSSLNQIHPRGTPTDNRFRASKTTYHTQNFGEILIDWSKAEPSIELGVIDHAGNRVIAKALTLDRLR